jgi:hypothetical protein
MSRKALEGFAGKLALLVRRLGAQGLAAGTLEVRNSGLLERGLGKLEGRREGWLARGLGVLERAAARCGYSARLRRYCARLASSSSTR